MATPEQAAALADQDTQEAIIELCCRECCRVDGISPDVIIQDMEVPASDEGPALVPAWRNYRRIVARTLAIVGAASHGMENLGGLKAAGDQAKAEAQAKGLA
jgi:hypothetical protein